MNVSLASSLPVADTCLFRAAISSRRDLTLLLPLAACCLGPAAGGGVGWRAGSVCCAAATAAWPGASSSLSSNWITKEGVWWEMATPRSSLWSVRAQHLSPPGTVPLQCFQVQTITYGEICAMSNTTVSVLGAVHRIEGPFLFMLRSAHPGACETRKDLHQTAMLSPEGRRFKNRPSGTRSARIGSSTLQCMAEWPADTSRAANARPTRRRSCSELIRQAMK